MSIATTLAPWRFAARLARREVRRHPWRSVLVVLLVAVPIAGMTIFSVVARTTDDTDWFSREYPGRTDLVVTRPRSAVIDLDDLLPVGAETSDTTSVWAGVATTGRVVPYVQFLSHDDFDSQSALSVSDGRAPNDGDVWLSSQLADDLGVDVGDDVMLRHPEGEWIVSGVGVARRGFDERIAVMPDLPIDQFRDEVVQLVTYIDLPAGVRPQQVQEVGWSIREAFGNNADGWAAWNEIGTVTNDEFAPLAWAWVIGTIGLAATGILIASAFATSARRQLVTIGLLSSNGSSERLTRRTLALQGAWTGVAGSALGIALGSLVLTAGRSTVERVAGYALPSYQFGGSYLLLIALTGVVAATLAAFVPARSASRVPVMAALAGRRPLGRVPPRLVPRGLTLAAIGALLLVTGALSRDGGAIPTLAAIVGGVFVLIGMCCCSPLAVDWMGRAGGRLTGSWRLAGRSLARTRTRSAAVVTAIAVIGALTTAGAAVAANFDDEEYRQLPDDAVVLVPNRANPAQIPGEIDFAALSDDPAGDDTIARIQAVVPSSTWHERRAATWDPAPVALAADGSWEGDGELAAFDFVIADEAMMDLYELSDSERASLRDVGVLALQLVDTWLVDGAAATGQLRIDTERGEVVVDVVNRTHVVAQLDDEDFRFDGVSGVDQFMITEDAAREAGFAIVTQGGFIRSDSPLTERQRSDLQEVVYGYGPDDLGAYYRDLPLPGGGEENSPWRVSFELPDGGTSGRAVQAVLLAVAFVLTLLVVAIGLALAAAEGANERDVLVAVGGRPGTMRSVAASGAMMLTLTGVLLAVPFGLLPIFAVMRAVGEPLRTPWLVIGALLVAVPALAGGAAWFVSAIAQRVRPVRLSNLAFD